MKYKFEINGTIKLIIQPEGNVETEIFKELIAGNMKISPIVTTNSTNEILIEKVKKEVEG